MDTTAKTVDIDVDGCTMAAILAWPREEGPWPGVVVAIEGFGVTDHIVEVTRRLAGEGYVALVPDMYHRLGRLKTAPYDDYDAARALMRTMGDDEIVADLSAALDYLKSRPQCRSDALGLIGFRVGGRAAYLTACRRPDVRAVVSFYGNLTSTDMTGRSAASPLELTDRLGAAVLMLWGQGGEPLSSADVAMVDERLKVAGKTAESVVYDGVKRGFFCNPDVGAYREDIAADAWRRTVDWLNTWLAKQ